MFNSLDNLFKVRITEYLKIAVNRRLHFYIIGKSFTVEKFFQV